MANVLDAVIPRILTSGSEALREMAIFPRIVNFVPEATSGVRGSTVDVPIPQPLTTQTVVPANVPPSTADIIPTYVPIPMDQQEEAVFYLTDREMFEVMEGTVPLQQTEAVRAIANFVDTYIFQRIYQASFSYVGTIGEVPFQPSTGTADHEGTYASTRARRNLKRQAGWTTGERYFVMGTDAGANAVQLPAYQYVNQSGSNDVMFEGELGRRLGLWHYENENIDDTTHTLGATTGTSITVNGASQTGYTLAVTGLTGQPVAGDLFTIAGDTTEYVVQSATTLSGADSTLTIFPALSASPSDGAVLTFIADHTVHGVAFNRLGFGLAMRPLPVIERPGSIMETVFDEVSGISMRLEVTGEHKRTRFSYEVLFGGAQVRPEMSTRIIG